jgi:hypothetical protein
MSDFKQNFQKAMAAAALKAWRHGEWTPAGPKLALKAYQAAAPQSRGMGTLTEAEQHELVNLYHHARTALSGTGKTGKYQQMLWASREFSKLHPDVTSTAAYKHLDRMGF